MHLKSITVKGFKSFPDRTRLEFGPGVSVIVGPNGSGKSNITDAVLWAMGEQSPLAVRGQSMQDVIFAGARGQDLSTQMRLGEYKDALNLIGRHPWLGVGYAGTPDIDLYIGVSSLYLLLAENVGLIGVAAFGAVIAAFFVLARRGIRADDGRLEPVILGGAAAIFGILVAGVFDHYFVNITFPASVTLFWFVIGLTTAAVAVARRH